MALHINHLFFVADGPEVEVEPEVLNVDEGEPAVIKCSSPSDPEPELTWGYGSPDGPLPDDVDVAPDGSTLTIPKCRQGHNGEWFCTGTNKYGKDTKPAMLTVEKPSTLPIIPYDLANTREMLSACSNTYNAD